MDKNQEITSLYGRRRRSSSVLLLVQSKVGRTLLDLRPRPATDRTRPQREDLAAPAGRAEGAVQAPSGTRKPRDYRLMLTRSFSMSSEVVITFEFAWKPRSAMIMFVNS